MIDRVFLGYVTDFLQVGRWPVFNIADSLVSIGIVGIVLVIIREEMARERISGNEPESHIKRSRLAK
jgi:lipoprotein signal peptidase